MSSPSSRDPGRAQLAALVGERLACTSDHELRYAHFLHDPPLARLQPLSLDRSIERARIDAGEHAHNVNHSTALDHRNGCVTAERCHGAVQPLQPRIVSGSTLPARRCVRVSAAHRSGIRFIRPAQPCSFVTAANDPPESWSVSGNCARTDFRMLPLESPVLFSGGRDRLCAPHLSAATSSAIPLCQLLTVSDEARDRARAAR